MQGHTYCRRSLSRTATLKSWTQAFSSSLRRTSACSIGEAPQMNLNFMIMIVFYSHLGWTIGAQISTERSACVALVFCLFVTYPQTVWPHTSVFELTVHFGICFPRGPQIYQEVDTTAAHGCPCREFCPCRPRLPRGADAGSRRLAALPVRVFVFVFACSPDRSVRSTNSSIVGE